MLNSPRNSKSYLTKETDEMIRDGKLKTRSIRIDGTETSNEMAAKIWLSFEVGQSCTIRRYDECYCVQNPEVKKLLPVGEFVIEWLIRIIKEELRKTNVNQVKRARGRNFELGVEESKLFRYNQDGKTGFVTIWRVR